MSDEPEPPTEDIDVVDLVIRAAACAAFAYFAWQPLDNFFRPIVDALLTPLLRAVGL